MEQVYFAGNKQNRFLNPVSDNRGEYSDVTADLIDKEVQRIIDDQYERALKILKDKRRILDQAAVDLLKNEVIEGGDLKALSESVSYEEDCTDVFDCPKKHITLAA